MVDGTPLTSARALYALSTLLGDTSRVASVVAAFESWDDLVGATPYELMARLGPWAGSLHIPATCPLPPFPGKGVRVSGRFDHTYPPDLAAMPLSPPLLYQRGNLPAAPLVAVGGVHDPSVPAIERAKATGSICAEHGFGMAGLVDTGTGRAALEVAVDGGAPCIAVLGSGLGSPSAHDRLINRVLAAGGAAVSVRGPGSSWSERATIESSAVVAALSTVVVVPEFGTHLAGGIALVESALELGRPLVACLPGPAGVPIWASTLLVRGRRLLDSEGRIDLPPELQSNERALLRALIGDPIADVVVGSADELANAIAAAVRGT